MKAIRVHEFGPASALRYDDAPEPTLGPGDVLVNVRAVGVNPFDTYMRAGGYAIKPDLPYIPGIDGAGSVEAVGGEVDNIVVGSRVYFFGTRSSRGTGAYAERAVCSPSQVQALPESATFAQGAAVGVPYATAHRALFGRASAQPGEIVLVHGASGGVGIAAVQLARSRGLTVIGTAGTEAGLELVRAQGAHHVFNHNGADYMAQVMEATGGRGANVIIEMLANVNLDRDLTALAARGRIVVVGNRGRVEIDPRMTMGKDGAILGMSLWNIPPAELAAIHAELVAGLADGALRPVVGREMPLAEGAAAHEAVMKPGSFGKIVLVP